jgi:hypothetical protein
VKNADQRARNAKELIKLFAEKDCDVGSFNETQIIRTTLNQIRETVPIEYDGIKEAKLTKRKKNLPIIVISIAALVLICLLFIFNRNDPKIVLTEAKTPLVDSASKQKNDIAATLNNKNDVNESAQTRVPNASQSSNTKKTEGLDNVTSENNNISSKPSTETVNKTPNNQNQSTEVIFLKPEILGIYRIASSDHRRKFLSLNGSASVVTVGLNEVQISGSIIAEIELLDKEDQPYTQTFSASFKTPNIQILPAADRVRCLASGSLKTEGPFNSRSGTINEILFIFDDFIELHSPTFTYFQMYKIHFER